MLHEEIQNAGEKPRFGGGFSDIRRIEACNGKETAEQFRFSGNIGEGIDGNHFRVGQRDQVMIRHFVRNSLSVRGKVEVR